MIRTNAVKRVLIFVLAVVMALPFFALIGCSSEPEDNGKHTHVWGEYVTVKDATCVENGLKERVCSVCGEKESVVTDKSGHSFGEWIAEIPATCTEDGVRGHKDCSVCHKHFDAEGNEIENLTIEKGHSFGEWVKEIPATYENDGVKGHYVCSLCGKYFDKDFNEISDLKIDKLVDEFDEDEGEFPNVEIINSKAYIKLGYYPQTVLTDSETIEKLDALIKGGLVANSFGYYELDGNYYLKKTAAPYIGGDSYNKFTDGSVIENGKDYYFIVEPVLWRVLKTESNKYTLMSEKALDARMFDPLQFAEEENGVTHNPNDYSLSYIRSWLNGDFYAQTFKTFEKDFVVLSSVDNGENTLYHPANTDYYTYYVYDDTSDKIFLPSYADMYNEEFGFDTDADRMALATDYLRASGTYMVPMVPEGTQIGYAKYWLRSAGGSNEQNVSIINCYGQISENQGRLYNCSVRPMMIIENG